METAKCPTCIVFLLNVSQIIYLSILIPMLMHETSQIRWEISRIRIRPDRAYPLHFTLLQLLLLQLLQLLLPLLCVSETGWDGIRFFLFVFFLGPILWNYQISAFNFLRVILRIRNYFLSFWALMVQIRIATVAHYISLVRNCCSFCHNCFVSVKQVN